METTEIINKLDKIIADWTKIAEMRESERIGFRTWAEQIHLGELAFDVQPMDSEAIRHFNYAHFARLTVADLKNLRKDVQASKNPSYILNEFIVKLRWGKHLMEKYLVEAEDCLGFVIKDVEALISSMQEKEK
ncbi:MAG: hypothetical protein KGO96_07020 [Elusimicrobia bacterium]|nr:hypothetical protein [Elusimicrobiota bacterium]